jgi:hypothetical protein
VCSFSCAGECGRRCPSLCSLGASCGGNRDCASGDCRKGVCISTDSTLPTSSPTATLQSTSTSSPLPTPTAIDERLWSISDIRSLGDFGTLERDSYGSENRAYVEDPVDRNLTTLRVRYPAKSFKPSVKPVGGTGFYAKPVDLSNSTIVTLEYDLLFPAGFDFVKGGKLPGLYGGRSSCSGGNSAKDCFSTRFMFRSKGAGELYVYADQSKQVSALCTIPPLTVCNPSFGISAGRGSFSFTPGKWNRLTQRIVLNTAGKNDGAFAVWLDGKLAMNFSQMFWRAQSDMSFVGIDFQTFFGGGDSSWATPTEQFTYYRNFKLIFN